LGSSISDLENSDVRAITNQVSLKWNKEKVHFLPGMGDFGGKSSGIHVPMKGLLSEKESRFSCQLNLNEVKVSFLLLLEKKQLWNLIPTGTTPAFKVTGYPLNDQ